MSVDKKATANIDQFLLELEYSKSIAQTFFPVSYLILFRVLLPIPIKGFYGLPRFFCLIESMKLFRLKQELWIIHLLKLVLKPALSCFYSSKSREFRLFFVFLSNFVCVFVPMMEYYEACDVCDAVFISSRGYKYAWIPLKLCRFCCV